MPINEKQLNRALQSQTEQMATTNAEIVIGLKNIVKETTETCVENLKTANECILTLTNKLAELERKVISQDIIIEELRKEQSSQKQTIESLNLKMENIEIRARSKNLILHGIKEEADEAGPALKRKIREVLNKHFGMATASIDVPSRLGAPPKDKRKIRPVLVSFNFKSDRDKILYRKFPDCPISVKADLPPETAAKQRILGQLTRWAREENIKTKRTDHYVESNITTSKPISWKHAV